MNKSDIIKKVAQDVKFSPFVLPRVNAKVFMDSAIRNIKETLINEEPLFIVGFGTFQPYWKKSRKYKNPQTGEYLYTGKQRSVRFIPSKDLKEMIIEERTNSNLEL